MGNPNPQSKPMRIARTVIRLFDTGQDVSLSSIQRLLAGGEDPIVVSESDLNKFLTEKGRSVLKGSRGRISLREGVTKADLPEWIADLEKEAQTHGPRTQPDSSQSVLSRAQRK